MAGSNLEKRVVEGLNSSNSFTSRIRRPFVRKAAKKVMERFQDILLLEDLLKLLNANPGYCDRHGLNFILELIEKRDKSWLVSNLTKIMDGNILYESNNVKGVKKFVPFLREIFLPSQERSEYQGFISNCVDGERYNLICQNCEDLEQAVISHVCVKEFPYPYMGIEKVISRAAYKLVVKLKDAMLNEYKAGKIIDIACLGKKHITEAGYDFKTWLEQEYKKMEKLQMLKHPNICVINHPPMMTSSGKLVMIEEIFDRTLDEEIESRRRNRMNPAHKQEEPFYDAVIRYTIEITRAIAACHNRDIIHEDLKPKNIGIKDTDSSSIVKLTDFSYARCQGSIDTMSPEVAAGSSQDKRSNIFSIGAIMYWMITGVYPFQPVDDKGRYMKKPPCDSEKRADYEDRVKTLLQDKSYYKSAIARLAATAEGCPAAPTKLVKIIQKCMSYNPDDRYQNGSELMKAFSLAGYFERNFKNYHLGKHERKELLEAALDGTLNEKQQRKLRKVLGVED